MSDGVRFVSVRFGSVYCPVVCRWNNGNIRLVIRWSVTHLVSHLVSQCIIYSFFPSSSCRCLWPQSLITNCSEQFNFMLLENQPPSYPSSSNSTPSCRQITVVNLKMYSHLRGESYSIQKIYEIECSTTRNLRQPSSTMQEESKQQFMNTIICHKR